MQSTRVAAFPRVASVAASMLLVVAFTNGAIGQGVSMSKSAFDHSFQAIDGGKLDLAHYRGKVLLVVNTASFCGYTRQYEGLQKLWERYEAKGLVVIGVPSNDFGGQEPKAEDEIKTFCEGAFGVTFPLTAKYEVKGAGAHPFYKWVTEKLGTSGQPRWNFHKVLIGRSGKAIAAYPSGTEPLSPTLVQAIEKELAAASQS